MKAIVVADGDVPAPELIGATLAAQPGHGRPLVVAADGGALKAELLGLQPDVVVGDLDSLSPEKAADLEARGVELHRHPAAKEASDTELAVLEALRRGATEIVILGGLGGVRFDHALANVLMLSLPELAGCKVSLVDGAASLRVMGTTGPDHLEIEGRPGELVSLLPLSEEVVGVRTEGLAFALHGETLRQGPGRGLSNVLQGPRAAVDTEAGRLAVVHSRVIASAPAGG